MAPNIKEVEHFESEHTERLTAPQAGPRIYDIVYLNIIKIGYLHILTLYGVYLCFTSAKWATVLFAYACYIAATIGVTAGAHRLWSHQSYKAKMPLQIILIIFLSMANQRATHWVRDHRLHHKHTDTDADPHNATRGFFYSHIGWLFVKKHPQVKERGSKINLSDLYNNPVVRFQHKYAKYFIFAFILPTLIPVVFWEETLNIAWTLTIMRYVLNFHIFFLVNSAAHMWGNKPYDKNILSVDNINISLATLGEGYHNFHHTFPWDYRSSELGNEKINYTRMFIDFFAKIGWGWAYDLKTVNMDTIEKRAARSGDGSRMTFDTS